MNIQKIILSLTLATCILAVHAQNTPNGATAPNTAYAKRTPAYLPDASKDYVRAIVPQKPVTDSSLVNINQLIEDMLVSTQYFDELSRPLETITKQASPNKKDFVSPIAFDAYNRTPILYMPYAASGSNDNDGKSKGSVFSADSAFYKGQFANEQVYYSENAYDGSPMNRVLKQYAPGNSWGGSAKGIATTVRANTAADSVRLWTIAISTEDDVPATSQIYTAGSLMEMEVTDERGVKAIKYINQLGQTVLTKTQLATSPGTAHAGWLCTYYIYDESGSLRYVIPPKATELLMANSWNFSATALSGMNTKLCYSYWYDSRGRVTMKSIPGKGKIYIAYDKMDRAVMTQDANLRAGSQWTFIKYDTQSRPVKTGLITMSGLSAATVISNAAASYDYPTLSGTYSIQIINHYDDYSFVTGNIPSGTLVTTNINSTNFFTTYNASPEYAQQITQSNRIRGALTGVEKNNLYYGGYLYTVNIYDDHGRIIQTKQTNVSGATDVATVQYSYTGRVLRSHLAHQFISTTTISHNVLTKYSYDHVGRLKTITKNIDALGDKITVQNTYNELGQLSSKNIGNGLETQSFKYNIRGWLLGINDGFVETTNSTNYFGEKIYYDYGFTNTQVNGNIAGVKWRQTGDDIQRAYGFAYDNTNRLITADFTQQNSGSTSWTNDKIDFSLSGLTYDANGNILTLKQKGVTVNTPATVDSLIYTYFTNSNQLQKVTDGISDMGPWGDFKDTSLTGDDYTYDANGNILKDYNKHIVSYSGGDGIYYNYLDKPTTISLTGKGFIDYAYDAAGMLLQKTVVISAASTQTITTYAAGFVYQKTLALSGDASAVPDTLQYVLHEEGRIRNALKKNSSTGAMYFALEYDYFLKDHLGNVRTIITEGKDTAIYVATMEPAYQTTEQALFDNEYDPVNTIVSKPSGFDNVSNNTKVTKLNSSTGTGKPLGPGIILKVMAGDKIQLSVYAWYSGTVQGPGGVNPFTDLLSAITGSVIGGSSGKLTSNLNTSVSNAISPNLTNFINGRNYNSSRPKAHLNWILLDEQLSYVQQGSNAVQVPTVSAGAQKQAIAPMLQTMSKSGYLYVYLSNESQMDVYFDDLTVTHYSSALVSEESYYPFGGDMAALKSNAAMKTVNRYKFNAGTELNESFDIDYYETYFRNYDAQLGKFTGVDMLAELDYDFSPYSFATNDPIFWNDPAGLSCTAPPEEYSGPVTPLNDVVVSSTRSTGGGFHVFLTSFSEMANGMPTWMFPNGMTSGGGGSRGGSYNYQKTDNDYKFPITIAESKDRRNGEDMRYNDTKPDENLPNVSLQDDFSDDELLFRMSGLFSLGTMGTNISASQMGKVAFRMINKFKEGKGGIFKDNDLSEAVKNNSDFLNWLNNLAIKFEEQINSVKGDLNKLSIIKDQGPSFGWSHILNGLAITIDAFNYIKVTLTDFHINSQGQYTADIHIYLEDAFGLDKNDVLSKGYLHPGFAAWWLLQHTRKGYVPFSTIIELSAKIGGQLKK